MDLDGASQRYWRHISDIVRYDHPTGPPQWPSVRAKYGDAALAVAHQERLAVQCRILGWGEWAAGFAQVGLDAAAEGLDALDAVEPIMLIDHCSALDSLPPPARAQIRNCAATGWELAAEVLRMRSNLQQAKFRLCYLMDGSLRFEALRASLEEREALQRLDRRPRNDSEWVAEIIRHYVILGEDDRAVAYHHQLRRSPDEPGAMPKVRSAEQALCVIARYLNGECRLELVAVRALRSQMKRMRQWSLREGPFCPQLPCMEDRLEWGLLAGLRFDGDPRLEAVIESIRGALP